MSDISSDSDEPALKRRKRNPESHKKNIIRSAKVKGIEHTNLKGKIVQARKTGESCKCNKKCFDNFNEDQQLNILFKFNSFASKDEQDIFLQNLIEKHDIKTRRPRTEIPKSRQCSFEYFVLKNGDRINEMCIRDSLYSFPY